MPIPLPLLTRLLTLPPLPVSSCNRRYPCSPLLALEKGKKSRGKKKVLTRAHTFLDQFSFPITDNKVNTSSLSSLELNSTLFPGQEWSKKSNPNAYSRVLDSPFLSFPFLSCSWWDPHWANSIRTSVPQLFFQQEPTCHTLHPNNGSTCQQEENLFSCHNLPWSSLPVSKAPEIFMPGSLWSRQF